ncbi:MAG: tetratricopeptide repeat protein [Marinospirillum sp.]|uniref:hypothetical protein n=1 Tax=Marinospirillum sp. TaxID=2183934 RepID=UPI0019F3B447|nr:hypothetical protein [Marinospirillum sp.]MBE0506820.1 tetratricopeptide repeat protein [Marinospirillum sp.]
MKRLLLAGCISVYLFGAQASASVALTTTQYEQLNRLGDALSQGDQPQTLELGKQLYQQPTGTAEQQAFIRAFAARVLTQLHLQQDKPELAAEVLVGALRDETLLDHSTLQAMRWLLMQVRINQGNHQAALVNLERWWQHEETPSADAHYLRAALLAQLQRWADAEPWLVIALQQQTPDSWLNLGVAIYQRQEKWPQAAALQQQRVRQTPENASLWSQLAQLQQLAGQDKDVLVTLELAQRRGYLSETEQQQLGLRLLNAEQPLRAARVFELLLKTTPDIELMRYAARAWMQTSQPEATADALLRLAQASNDQDDWQRLGDWHYSQGNWQQAVDAWMVFHEALSPRDQASLTLLIANAYIELRDYEQARLLLESLLATSEEMAARQWLNYINAL